MTFLGTLSIPPWGRSASFWLVFMFMFVFGGGAARASEEIAPLRFSGFGTVGIATLHAPDGWGLRRDILQSGSDRPIQARLDSQVGAQLNYSPSARWEFVGQVLARERAAYSRDIDAVEWAFGAFRPDGDTTIRLGRMNVPAFILSDHRQVGFAYAYARPPVEFYGWLPSVLDGVDVSRQWRSGDARWSIQGFAGRSRTGDLHESPGLTVGPGWGVRLRRESDGLLLHATLASAGRVEAPPWSIPVREGLTALAALPVPSVSAQALAIRDRVDVGRAKTTYAALGTSIEHADWTLTAEASLMNMAPARRDRAAYVSLSRRSGDVTWFGAVSRLQTVLPRLQAVEWAGPLTPLIGPVAAAQAQAMANAAVLADGRGRPDQSTVSLGLRWDTSPRNALKLQIDRTHIHAYGGMFWTGGGPQAARATVGSISMDFIF